MPTALRVGANVATPPTAAAVAVPPRVAPGPLAIPSVSWSVSLPTGLLLASRTVTVTGAPVGVSATVEIVVLIWLSAGSPLKVRLHALVTVSGGWLPTIGTGVLTRARSSSSKSMVRRARTVHDSLATEHGVFWTGASAEKSTMTDAAGASERWRRRSTRPNGPTLAVAPAGTVVAKVGAGSDRRRKPAGTTMLTDPMVVLDEVLVTVAANGVTEPLDTAAGVSVVVKPTVVVAFAAALNASGLRSSAAAAATPARTRHEMLCRAFPPGWADSALTKSSC